MDGRRLGFRLVDESSTMKRILTRFYLSICLSVHISRYASSKQILNMMYRAK